MAQKNKANKSRAKEAFESPAKTGKMSDISKDVEPSANARPLISGHKQLFPQNDPMVKHQTDDKSDAEEKKDLNTKQATAVAVRKSRLEPLSKTEEPEDTAGLNQSETSAKTDEGAAADENDQPDKTEKENPEIEAEKNDADQEAKDKYAELIDSYGGNSLKKQKLDEEAAEQKRRDILKELIASRKYALPIHEGAGGGVGSFVNWFLLLLIIASLGGVIAIDGGYLDIGIDLPFDLIK